MNDWIYSLSQTQRDIFLFILLFVTAAIPILATDTLPLYDLPNHTARIAVIQARGLDPLLSQYYILNWHFVTNLAIDMWAYITTPLLTPEQTGRYFILLCFLLLSSGTIYLHRTLGGKGYLPYIAFIFLYNEILAYGFLSFLFTIGLALWMFAFWVKNRGGTPLFRLCIFSIGAVFLLTCHLFGFALYALAVGSYELANLYTNYNKTKLFRLDSDFIIGAIHFALPLFIFFSLSNTSEGISDIEYSSLMGKIASFSSPILLYAPRLQLMVIALFVIGIGATLYKGKVLLAKNYWLIFLIGAICAILAPDNAFESYFLSHRMPVALIFLAIAGVQLKTDQDKGMLRKLGIAAFICFTLQISYITTKWQTFDKIYAELFSITEIIEPGSKVLSVVVGTESWSGNIAPSLIDAIMYLVPEKKIFTPHVFAHDWHHPIRFSETAKTLSKATPSPLTYPEDDKIAALRKALACPALNAYNYVLLIRSEQLKPLPKDWQLLAHKGLFELYRHSPRESVTNSLSSPRSSVDEVVVPILGTKKLENTL